MKQHFISACAGAAVLLVVAYASAANLTFGEIVDNLDKRVHTSMNMKEYWKKVKGQEVNWTGVVHDVQSGKSKARILVIDKSRPLYDGYNIRVSTEDMSKASSLKKGQQIRFKGILDNFHAKDSGASVIDVSEATIL